jgi:hypothetical protein
MPEDCANFENYGNYEQQPQDVGQFCPPDCNQCSPPPTASNGQQQGYYDCSDNQCYNMAGRDCTDYCDPQCFQNDSNQQDEISMSYEPVNQAGGDNSRPCSDSCQLPMCSPFKKRRYVQPPRRQSFRPNVAYKKPSIPMSTETIYRKSFEGVDSSTAMCCRPSPYNPSGFLRIPGGPFEKETVTKMSFQPYDCGIERRLPIKPAGSSLLGKGPMQALTTQKHDFVPKFQYRRQRIEPRDNISKSCGCIEKCTIQRMSFMPPCGVNRTKSFKPVVHYKKPDLPMEFETTQKLSYMPVCPKTKDDMPWAKKAAYLPPSLPFAKDTVTKLSFQPPGCFIDDDYCCEPCEPNYCEMPRAAAC